MPIEMCIGAHAAQHSHTQPSPAALSVRLKPPQMQALVTDELAIEGVMCGRRPHCKRNLACGLRSGASHVSGLLMRSHDRWP